ncbi:hypothetical protein ACFXA3_00070 [Streptomyces sp. NPDC059456]|uniref:hypothetical protein n=1 Tax=Streptomyces sp. NPDC059456 TaxID=3346838 RepID=UPI0036A95F31
MSSLYARKAATLLHHHPLKPAGSTYMATRKTLSTDTFGHQTHPWIGKTVTDIACQQTGELMAVVIEPAGFASGAPRVSRLAYIKAASGIEWSTALANVELAAP